MASSWSARSSNMLPMSSKMVPADLTGFGPLVLKNETQIYTNIHKYTLLMMQTQKRRKLPYSWQFYSSCVYSLKAAVTPDNYQIKVQTKCFSCCGKGSHAGENELTMILTWPSGGWSYLSELFSTFSFLSTSFRAAARDVLVWSSLCWATSTPMDGSGGRPGPNAYMWDLPAARDGLWGAWVDGAGGPRAGEDGEAKARLWTTLTVTVGDDSPAEEDIHTVKHQQVPSEGWDVSTYIQVKLHPFIHPWCTEHFFFSLLLHSLC